jgi:hypothetical protein
MIVRAARATNYMNQVQDNARILSRFLAAFESDRRDWRASGTAALDRLGWRRRARDLALGGFVTGSALVE